MFKIILTFITISIITFISVQYFDLQYGKINFWSVHGLFFLIFLTLFPRLTLLLSSVVSGGFLWWLSWLFFPRYLIAILSTIGYWNTNKILVTCAWIIAMSGESSEKIIIIKNTKKYTRKNRQDKEYTDAIPAKSRVIK